VHTATVPQHDLDLDLELKAFEFAPPLFVSLDPTPTSTGIAVLGAFLVVQPHLHQQPHRAPSTTMSDYGDDDYSDYGDDWLYVEDEYTAADDLAEHVAPSPPPTTYLDDDPLENWDRFDYFNDLEYASDGYDDAEFYTLTAQSEQLGQKRKRGTVSGSSRKRQKAGMDGEGSPSESAKQYLSPVVWRSRAEREAKLEQKLWEEESEPYALLKDWRERMVDTPAWAAGSPAPGSSSSQSLGRAKGKAAIVSEPDYEEEEDDDDDDDDDAAIDPSVLMAALQKNLAAQGGPLSEMDPEQLLQFAMRMMNGEAGGDEIAGELADDMLNQGSYEEDGEDEEEEEEAPADLLSWLSKQHKPNHGGPAELDAASSSALPNTTPQVEHNGRDPPTPPSSETTRSIPVVEDVLETEQARDRNGNAYKNNATHSLSQDRGYASRKRKAADDEDDGEGDGSATATATAAKKRATRSFDRPTAASQARSAPVVKARGGRAKR
jgi:hypothetical protein